MTTIRWLITSRTARSSPGKTPSCSARVDSRYKPPADRLLHRAVIPQGMPRIAKWALGVPPVIWLLPRGIAQECQGMAQLSLGRHLGRKDKGFISSLNRRVKLYMIGDGTTTA